MYRSKEYAVCKVDVAESARRLFDLNARAAGAGRSLLSPETESGLVDFLIRENMSETWVWKDSGGEFVGCLSLVNRAGENAVEILNIGVDPMLQGRGLGREMMAFAEKVARNHGRGKMVMVADKDDPQAEGLCTGMGYMAVKETGTHYARCVFEKVLDP